MISKRRIHDACNRIDWVRADNSSALVGKGRQD